MSLFTCFRDNLVNVRKRDYKETVEMHKALEALFKKKNTGIIPADIFIEKYFPDLPVIVSKHFCFLAEKVFELSGLYAIQPLPEYEDTEAIYYHREYIRGMTPVIQSFDEYENIVLNLTHVIITKLAESLPDTLAGDETELSFEVPATQFFHQTGHDIIDYVVGYFFHDEIKETPLFAPWRAIIIGNFQELYTEHRIKNDRCMAKYLKDKLPLSELLPAVFSPLPLPNLFNFSVPFVLPTEDRYKHQYVLGKTGSGKSVLLRHQIAHDLNAGHGVVVMTPERDLINDVLSYVPDSRADDVVYFDASDSTAPAVGFNPFALYDNDESARVQRAGELELILERTLGGVLGIKMKPVLSNCIYALLALQGSFHDIPKLIDPNDPSFRRSIMSKLDVRTRDFFQKYDTSKYYKEVYEPVINRLDSLLRPPLATTLVASSLNFNQLLNHTSSIVLCNLSRLRGFQAEIVGQLLLATFQQTFFIRDSIPKNKRRPYFFYMDEFQTYATASEKSLDEFLTRVRKYNVGTVMAHQNTDGIPTGLVSSIFGNGGTFCGMLMSVKDASIFTRNAQLANFRGFDRAETQLQNFSVGEFAIATPEMKQARICRAPERPPFSFSFDRVDQLKARSKARFGISVKATEPSKQKPPDDNEPPENWEDLGYKLS